MSDADIAQQMIKVMRSVTSVGKSDRNSHFGFMFRGIDTVLDAVGPALRDHGVLTIPELLEMNSETIEKPGKGTNAPPKTSVRVTVRVAYHFVGPTGDRITAVVPGEAVDEQDKASSKAMSVAYRTALIQTLAIPTGERDPHAGDPVTTKLAKVREQVKAAYHAKNKSFEGIADDYALWSQGADLVAADADDLVSYLKTLDPNSTTKYQRKAGVR